MMTMMMVMKYSIDTEHGAKKKSCYFVLFFFFLPAALKTVPVPSPGGLAGRVTQIWGCVL